jgi:hypothetical protein
MGLHMRLILAFACCVVLGACGGDGTRVCFGSERFCGDALGRNRPPEASAGRDRQVVAGEEVELDGTGSFDPDGRISSYSWTQRSGDPVTLEDASEAIAFFTAPDVEVETVLEFRLVVADDDDASDADRVRITVLPAASAALRAGVALLKTVHAPPAAATEPDCRRCWSLLGLWLGARVGAAAAGADPSLDELLDELRVIEQLQTDQGPGPALPEAHRRLFQLGQQRAARFTARRDPATAELARRHGAAPAGPDRAEVWRRDLLAAYPELDWFDGSPAARDRATRLLLDAPAGMTPEAAAAATLLLALPDA